MTADLYILDYDGVQFGFISRVRLQVHVLWSGGVRVTWDPAMASANTKGQHVVRNADQYKLELFDAKGRGLYRFSSCCKYWMLTF